MKSLQSDPRFKSIVAALDDHWALEDETIKQRQQVLVANERKDALETRLATELRLNGELKTRLAKISNKGEELDKLCSRFQNKLTMKKTDQTKLNTAKEMYEIAKLYTGIRWDYTAPPDRAKGFVKSVSKMTLESFELEYGGGGGEADGVPGALWAMVRAAAALCWDDLLCSVALDKENIGAPLNK